MNEEKFNAIFNQFDTDGSGTISRENIITAMNKMGQDITQEELDEIMRVHDIEKNNVITKDEFKAVFLGTDDLQFASNYEF